MRLRWLPPLFVVIPLLSACSATDRAQAPVTASPTTTQAPAAAPNGPGAASSKAEDSLTAQNNREFAALLAGPGDGETVEAFSEKFRAKAIMFDGHVAAIGPGKLKGSYSYLILNGDDGAPPSTGPNFQISGDPAYAGSNIPKNLEVGQEVRITALVGEYDGDTELLRLLVERPDSIVTR